MSNVVHWGSGESVQRVWTILGFNLRLYAVFGEMRAQGKD